METYSTPLCRWAVEERVNFVNYSPRSAAFDFNGASGGDRTHDPWFGDNGLKSALLVLLQELVWGNNRDPIFGNDDGYQSFKECLLDAAKRDGLLIHAYLLMTNHTHLLASPDATNSEPKTVAIEPRVGWRDVTPRLWIRRTKRNYKIREYMMANLKPFSIAIVSWGMLSLCPAMAVDLEAQSLNTVIADGVVQIGNHRYPLPPGEWTLIAKQVGTTTGDTVRQGVKTVRGYFVTLQGKTFKSGLLLWGTANSSALASSAGWIDDPCKRDDVLYKNILDKGFKYPDCLMVNHYVGHLKVNNGWLEDAARWVQTNQVSIPTTVLSTTYNGYVYGDAVAFRLFVNPELAGIGPSKDSTWRGNDWHKDRIKEDPEKLAFLQRFIEWAEQVPKVYKAALLRDAPATGLTSLPDLNTSEQRMK